MLYEEVALYEKLTGQNANDVSVTKIGAYLDGYEKGLSVLEDIKAEIEKEIDDIYVWENDEYALGETEMGKRIMDIIDKHMESEDNNE